MCEPLITQQKQKAFPDFLGCLWKPLESSVCDESGIFSPVNHEPEWHAYEALDDAEITLYYNAKEKWINVNYSLTVAECTESIVSNTLYNI